MTEEEMYRDQIITDVLQGQIRMLDFYLLSRVICAQSTEHRFGEASPHMASRFFGSLVHNNFFVLRDLGNEVDTNTTTLRNLYEASAAFQKTTISVARRYTEASEIVNRVRSQAPTANIPPLESEQAQATDLEFNELSRFTRQGAGHLVLVLSIENMAASNPLPVIGQGYAAFWDHLIKTIVSAKRVTWRTRALWGFAETARILGPQTPDRSFSLTSVADDFLAAIRPIDKVEQVATACITALGHDGKPYRANHLVANNKKRPTSPEKKWLATVGNWKIERLDHEEPPPIPSNP